MGYPQQVWAEGEGDDALSSVSGPFLIAASDSVA